MNKVLFAVMLLLISVFSFSQTRIEAESYTAMSGVSVENGWGDGGCVNIYPIDQGDWMEYTVNPAISGNYTFNFRVGTIASGAQLKVKKADGTVLATVDLPAGTDYQIYQGISASISLSAGSQTIRIESSAANTWTFNWFEYVFNYKQEAENYTNMSGVTVGTNWGDGNGIDVRSIEQGDWMEYTIAPTTNGNYSFIFRIGTVTAGAQFKIKKTDGTVLATVNLPNTENFQHFIDLPVTLNLNAGQQTIRIESTAADWWTFNWFEYSYGYLLEAEMASSFSGGVAENCFDILGGQNWAYINADFWLDYSLNIATAGVYSVKFRVASAAQSKQLQIKKSDGTVLATVNIPYTGNWQVYQTVTTTISLPVGPQTLRIYALTDGWNFNWWSLEPANASPVANAGTNQMIATNTITLTGSGSDPDGTISSYSWTKLSGPTGSSFGTATAAATTVTGLISGTYVFRLTVTDNGGASGTADVTVNVVSGLWGTTGNNNIDESLHFIGTTNSQPLVFKAGGHSWAKLTTDGIFMTNKIKVLATGWADYVFDTTYKLRPLLDVERFIKQYQHLPDVPSEKEVINNGLDIGDNQAVLLKKIEELTLYIIDINKKIEKLSEENAELKQKLESKN